MTNLTKSEEMKYSEIYSKWYSWGSPVGLGILLVCIALAILLLGVFLNVLTESGKTGVEIEERLENLKD